MDLKKLLRIYKKDERVTKLKEELKSERVSHFHLKGLVGSSISLIASEIIQDLSNINVFIFQDKETAAYFNNDLENIFGERSEHVVRKKILFFPTSYKRSFTLNGADSNLLQLRTEVLDRIGNTTRKTAVVTYSEALLEKVVSKEYLNKSTLKIKVGDQISVDFIIDIFVENRFERVDFVFEPGQFAVRGGIVDVFSYSDDNPYRIEFFGDKVESIRTFDLENQLSLEKLSRISIVPNLLNQKIAESKEMLFDYLPDNTNIWIENVIFTCEKLDYEFEKVREVLMNIETGKQSLIDESFFTQSHQLLDRVYQFNTLEFGTQAYYKKVKTFIFNVRQQPSFNKNFELLINEFRKNEEKEFQNIIFSENPKQIERLYNIFEDIQVKNNQEPKISFLSMHLSLHKGFIDKDLKLACFTDHQLFERYHKFYLKSGYKSKEALTLKELYELKPGDYITHIDHGIGCFDGLEKIENNGKEQEAIRLIYKNNDLLYISIHSLHRIAKYFGKEGGQPSLNKLGSQAWNKLKNKTKEKVKDIAKDLIKLYAERKLKKGFSFSKDTYLQHELEASFFYEDTPDQLKSTADIKMDMENEYPMDRLVCGDVGFGKTEVAIRAAFKAVADSKQVAILVPTTILALQHFKTFLDRLKDFPCKIDYINRFKSTNKQKETLKKLKEGSIDILIGTHRLVSKDVEFKDLGLLIIDEEQKFGVSTKEKLKRLKINVDTLTLTATPIPRTLQFSLMGARDLSVINTPPPNRYPVQTEICLFSEKIIRDGILFEVSRGGQVFFVHNRVQNIMDIKKMIEKFCPGISIAIAHGQMEGKTLEKVMLDFINGAYDVLLATTIIESGLDIPNSNTIFINNAQNYGLSELHQLRGRVGRTNKKAFCYLLSPPLSSLTKEARLRLTAIEEFADLGSGFNIAMRDLDIRGAGNILGAEQSGFISEIGFEMYNQILNEALMELKENEFKDVFKTDETKTEFVKDCLIETDLELLIPDNYITQIAQRLSLYKELDGIKTNDELNTFREKLIDRFGPIPKQTQELINTICLRWLAKKIGFEKLIMKNKFMRGYFISNQESNYFESETFSNVIQYVKQNSNSCNLREKNDKLILSFSDILSVDQAIEKLQSIKNLTIL